MAATGSIAIAGGGIGGLAAAAALRRAGFEVVVFEKSPSVMPEGSALFIAANAVKALHEVGLGAAYMGAAQAQRDGELRSEEGKLLFRLPASLMIEAFGHPNTCVERTDLRRVLLEGAGRDCVRFGAAVEGFRAETDGVEVRLADGTHESFAALLGADGIGSAVRGQLLGPSRARYVGYTAWRGVSSPDIDFPTDVGVEIWGRGRRAGISHLGRGRWGWWATRLAPEGGADLPTSRSAAVALLFEGGWGPTAEIIRATPDERVLRNDIYVRTPDRAWGEGRVTLLGDAGHLMTPDLGQGACQAIIDGCVLARCATGAPSGDFAVAFRRYEALRIPQTASVARRSYRLGRSAHMRSRPAVALRNALFRVVPGRIQLARVRRALSMAG